MHLKNLSSQSGQGLTEYAVVLSLVALLAIGGISLLGSGLRGKVSQLTGAVVGDSKTVADANQRLKSLAQKAQTEARAKTTGMKNPSQDNVIGNDEASESSGQ